MPFLAEHPGTGVALGPDDVGEKFRRREDLLCPHCRQTLVYRKQGTNDRGEQVSRAHFVHSDNLGGSGAPGGCAIAGESPEHETWKMVIGELLKDEYGVDDYYVEQTIGGRTADVLVKSVAGKEGVVAEYQHKNKDKDYLGVTKEYVKNGYGVHWIFNTNSDYEMLFTAKEELERYMGRQPYLGERNHIKVSAEKLVKFGECISIDQLQPVPTRLEKYWAIFFDELGVEYRYHRSYVGTQNGAYLPDFYLPNIGIRSTEKEGMWVEVSEDVPNNWRGGVFDKMLGVVESSGEGAAIIEGSPLRQRSAENQYEVSKRGGNPMTDWPMKWVKCTSCGLVKYEFSESNYMGCQSCAGVCSPDHEAIIKAIEAVNERKRRLAIRQMVRS